MMQRITPKIIGTLINSISAVTTLAEVFANKPDEKAVPGEGTNTDKAYIYFDVRNDPETASGNAGMLLRRARITMYVVGMKNPGSGITSEDQIETIIGLVDDAILPGTTDQYQYLGSQWIGKILEVRGGETPMGYTEKNRAIKSKDYQIVYNARS